MLCGSLWTIISVVLLSAAISSGYQPNFLFHSCLRSRPGDLGARDHSTPRDPVVILHGLLGSSRNFQTWARLLQEGLGYAHDIICIDLPNHGRSTRLGGRSINYEHIAADLQHTLGLLNVRHAHLVGHSMGGKAAAAATLYTAESDLFRSLTIMDISPWHYSEEEFAGVSSSVRKLHIIDNAFTAQKYSQKNDAQLRLDELVRQEFEDKSLQLFILSNAKLRQNSDKNWGLVWSFHLKEILDGIDAVAAFPATSESNEIVTERKYNNPMLLLKGSDSNFIRSSHVPTIAQMFPLYNLATVRKAGHWLHFDQPEDSAKQVAKFISSAIAYHQKHSTLIEKQAADV